MSGVAVSAIRVTLMQGMRRRNAAAQRQAIRLRVRRRQDAVAFTRAKKGTISRPAGVCFRSQAFLEEIEALLCVIKGAWCRPGLSLLRGRAAFFAASAMLIVMSSSATSADVPLVALSSVAPQIKQDMRYAGAGNFTGDKVPGYEAGECWLRPAVAQALAEADRDLAKESPPLALAVFDCYRPRRAVSAFGVWARSAEDGRTRHYYPSLRRGELIERGFIARSSTHSRGIAVDLTIVRRQPAVGDANSNAIAATPRHAAGAAAPCTEEGSANGAADAIDMGSAFDCFDQKSHADHPDLTSAQRDARQTLRRVMLKHGFSAYAKEWWHFTFPAADDGRSFDVPVRAAPKR